MEEEILMAIMMIAIMIVAGALLISMPFSNVTWIKNDKQFKTFYIFIWIGYVLAAYIIISLTIENFKQTLELIELYGEDYKNI